MGKHRNRHHCVSPIDHPMGCTTVPSPSIIARLPRDLAVIEIAKKIASSRVTRCGRAPGEIVFHYLLAAQRHRYLDSDEPSALLPRRGQDEGKIRAVDLHQP